MNKLIYFILYIVLNTYALANTFTLLNTEEEQWLKDHPVISVGIDQNFAPFEYIDENKEFKGISADYLLELERILHVKFDIVKDKSWKEITKMIQDGSLDMLSCIVDTDQRAQYLNFTKPYLSFPMVIVTNKATGFITGMKDLSGKTVAVIEGYTPQDIIENNYKDIHLVKTKDLTQAMELVTSGKTFAHVGNLSRVTYLLKEKGFQNLSISGITKYRYDFAMGTKKDAVILQSILQKGIDALPQKIKDDIYYKWFPIKYNQSTNYTLPLQILAVATVILLIFLFWMFKLKKEINKRIFIEKQLKKNVIWLKNSLKKADVGAWTWDLRTNAITGNCVYAKILGLDDEELQISASEFQKYFIHKDDLPMVLQELEDYFGNVITSCKAKFRIHTKDGKIKTIESHGEIFQYDTYNNPTILFGFIKEIKD
jgi:ABC-type amino acid transport substrate-binding protein